MKLLQNTISAFVVLIIFFIIIPLPAALLDLMFILNLSIAFIILLMTMYIKETLEFSIFPALLLVTTLFRLSLNISSTRLILLNQGEAGQVIKTFGEFVIRGNALVGFIIFVIIVIVQFLVITKGAERVAEVSARFTLDAMPGKQMAIDADLSSGLIDENQARQRRNKIEREADFFGSMDGASKFVKGDAIMSIVIALINLVGGVAIGFMNDVGSMADIVRIYTTATVGDGLISQMPALVISVATGMIVTRSASESNLNADIFKQFSAYPKVLYLAGGCIASLTLIPGFPKPQILASAVVLFGLGYFSQKALVKDEEAPIQTLVDDNANETAFYRNIENVYGLLSVEAVEMEFGYSLIPLIDENSGGSFIDRVVMFRKQYAQEMGLVVPSVRLKDSGQLSPNQYVIKLKGEKVAQGDVLVDHYLALSPGEITEVVEGIDTIEPAFGIPARWISQDKKIRAELAGYSLIDPTSVIMTHLSEVVRAHASELLTRQELANILNHLKKVDESLVSETIPGLLAMSDLQKILGNLLRENIPIKDMQTIMETLAEYGPAVKDTDMLTEYVRQALKRTISQRFSEVGQLKVLTMDAQLENTIMSSIKRMDHGSYLALEPQVIQGIVNAVTQEVNKIKEMVQSPILLTSPIVRIYIKKLLDQFLPQVVVLSFNEVDQNIQIQAIGNIVLSQ